MRILFFIALFSITSHCAHAQIITTIAGGSSIGYSGDGGAATAATLTQPYSVAVDRSGNVYIMDFGNFRIRRVSTSDTITTFAGTGSVGYSGDGGAATSATFNYAVAVAVDGSGNVYIADNGNHRIRRVSTSGTITTFAGTGSAGYSGDGGAATAATLNHPYALAVDDSGNVYIADQVNECIRRVSTSGTITTIAGTGSAGYSGDGGAATAARLSVPNGIAIDSSGNVYIAEVGNHCIRRVSTSGIITTFAGTGIAGYSGDGGAATAATLHGSIGVAVDRSGNVYISDELNNRIRKVSTSGIITTFAGTGSAGYSGDGVAATAAKLYFPAGIAVDGSGSLYIADYGNCRIRRVSGSTTAVTGAVAEVSSKLYDIYPNPVSRVITVAAIGNSPISELVIYDLSGREVGRYEPKSTKTEVDMAYLAAGTYIFQIFSGGSYYEMNVVKE